MYLAQKTILEISNAVRELASYMDAPGEEHIAEMARTIWYVKQVQHKPLVLQQPFELWSIRKTNSNYAANAEDQKSVTGHLHTLRDMITNWAS